MRTNESLWKKIVEEVKEGEKGGRRGQWSARKAQLAVLLYKQRGGGYSGEKPDNDLTRWTRQDWRTKSGGKSLETGERYLPSAAIEKLSPQQYAATSRAKREGMKKGLQYVKQPSKIADLVKEFREN
jgi:hypothetical protein